MVAALERPTMDTTLMNCEIHRSMWHGSRLPNQLITGHDGRALAVHIPNLLDESFLDGPARNITEVGYDNNGFSPKQRLTRYSQLQESENHHGILPIGLYSGERLPDAVTLASDLIVQSVTRRTDVLATNLTVNDDGHLRRDTPRHYDNPGSPRKERPPWQPGVNLHIAFSGLRQVEFGLLDDDEAIEESEYLMTTVDNPHDAQAMAEMDARLGMLYREACSSWATVVQRPGDGLVFQGEARKGRHPIVHRFISTAGASALHGFGLIKPWAAEAAVAAPLRLSAETYIRDT